MKQVCWQSRRSKAYRGPRHELLWKKPPLRTSTCGRHRFRRNHPLWKPRMWQGQVWVARPDGESTRGKAKFGKRHGSRKWEEENSSTQRRHRGNGEETAETPLPPIQCNKRDRVDEIGAALDKIVSEGRLRPRNLQSHLGRLQFAEMHIAGRAGHSLG